MLIKTIKASELKEGMLLDGYDKVTVISSKYWGSVIRAFSLCNIQTFNANDEVRVAA